MSHKHFSRNERIQLAGFEKAGMSNKEMAVTLGKHPSSIGRELKKGQARIHGERTSTYSWKKSRKVTYERRMVANQQHRKLGLDADLTAHVRKKLALDWAPEQIVGRMRGLGDTRISYSSIYRYLAVQAPELRTHLHSQKGKYRRTQAAGVRRLRRLQLSAKRDITTRPSVVKQRKRLGDWEGDTIVGTGICLKRILTHVDRRSGYLLTQVVLQATTEAVRVAIAKSFATIPKAKRHTLTLDNGAEFTDWQFFEHDLDLTVYFAKPYHSWERGTNENTNGLLRHYFPKKSSFATLKPKQLSRATALLNHRPRKRLGYLTPYEVFHGIAI